MYQSLIKIKIKSNRNLETMFLSPGAALGQGLDFNSYCLGPDSERDSQFGRLCGLIKPNIALNKNVTYLSQTG